MDIICAKCGEPWDSYGVGEGDMTAADAVRFRKGEGCPCCGFGTKCTECSGTGYQVSYEDRCVHHCTNAKILAWMPHRDTAKYFCGTWYYGYDPNVKEIPPGSEKLEVLRTFECKDGRVTEAWFSCPIHHGNSSFKCIKCNGTGKLRVRDLALDACMSECEASDEDPLIIMERRGL